MPTLYHDVFASPIGPLTVAADATGKLHHILFAGQRHLPAGHEHWRHDPRHLARARGQLLEYLQGERREFTLELMLAGTAFQCEVWQALARIPYGTTASYAQLAHAIGRPNACRAVGAANGRNPLPMVLPCHRVIGASGALTGFAGGLPIKAALLRLENEMLGQARAQPQAA